MKGKINGLRGKQMNYWVKGIKNDGKTCLMMSDFLYFSIEH